MNYRQLQRNLKALRSQGVIPKSFKLNQKAAILRDALRKYACASDLVDYKVVPNLEDRTVTMVVNKVAEGFHLNTIGLNYLGKITLVEGAQYRIEPKQQWHYTAELQSFISGEIQQVVNRGLAL
jgi:hypothetical protein